MIDIPRMDGHWLLPVDPTPEEKDVAMFGMLKIYSQFPDPIDQLIIAQCFELNYPQSFVSKILNRSETTVSTRIKKIKTVLMRSHKAYIREE